MERIEVFRIVNELFCNVMNVNNVQLQESSSAADFDEWDSLNHVVLIDAIQKRFNIKFTAQEMLSWSNIGELVNCIEKKCHE